MKKYIARFNSKFSVTPSGASVYRKLGKSISLDYILCRKTQRKLDSGSAFSYGGNYYQLVSGGKPAAIIPRSRVSVLISARIGIKAEYSGKVYSLARLEKPKAKGYTKVANDRKLLPKKPIAGHPWKGGKHRGSKYDPRDEELALGLFNSTIAWETDNY